MDVLRRNLITKFDINQMATRSNSPDFGPSARNPRKVQIAVTMKFADIETIDRQFFKNQTLSFVDERYGASSTMTGVMPQGANAWSTLYCDRRYLSRFSGARPSVVERLQQEDIGPAERDEIERLLENLEAALQSLQQRLFLGKQLVKGCHRNASITRLIAGCLRFLILIQCEDRPAR